MVNAGKTVRRRPTAADKRALRQFLSDVAISLMAEETEIEQRTILRRQIQCSILHLTKIYNRKGYSILMMDIIIPEA
jgi:hypothetical protein